MTRFVLLAAALTALALVGLTRPWWRPARAADDSAPPPRRPSRSLALALTGFVVIVAAGGYSMLGTPQGLEIGSETAARAAASAASAEQASLSRSAQQVETLVDQLAERLKTHPDDPDGWVRLVRAYAVLGETAKREAALRDASTRYSKRPDILDQLAKAARAEPMR